MPLTRLENDLRPVARERIATGQLPSTAPAKTWGGAGSGALCSLCDRQIASQDLEYEVEAVVNDTVQTFRFHLVCESIWQLECARHAHLQKHPGASGC